MRKHYEDMVARLDSYVRLPYANKVTDKDNPHYGGYVSFGDGMIATQSGLGVTGTYAMAYCTPQSKYYKNAAVAAEMIDALRYVDKWIREDGTVDCLLTNFCSAPDTAFATQGLIGTYRILKKYTANDELTEQKALLLKIMKRFGDGMITGGFHTPNHRWVCTSALLMIYNETKDERYKQFAMRYLGEGIDCDENGEFTEKSAAIYNSVNDNALIWISNELGDDSFLESVDRNLMMMFTFFDPDNSIFTQNSTRQDNSSYKYFPTNYYHLYLYMAYKTRRPEFMYMVQNLYDNFQLYNNAYPFYLSYYMLFPELIDFECEAKEPNRHYNYFYKSTGIVRAANGNRRITILKDKARFLYCKTGKYQMYAIVAAPFYAKGQFVGKDIEQVDDNTYRMTFITHGSYKMPFPEGYNGTSNWEEMSHNAREYVKLQDLAFTVTIHLTDKGVSLNVKTTGMTRVPVKLEFVFDTGCLVRNEHILMHPVANQELVLKDGQLEVMYNDDEGFVIGECFGKHYFNAGWRGVEPQNPTAFTLYMTDYTNIDRTVDIEIRGIEK